MTSEIRTARLNCDRNASAIFLATIYPDNAQNYRPKKDWPRIEEALFALDVLLIDWQSEDGTGGARKAVYARDRPRASKGSRDDWIQFVVDLPPGSERGALVDRAALRLTGVTSGPAYRLALSLEHSVRKRFTMFLSPALARFAPNCR